MSQDSQNDKGFVIRIPKLKSQGGNYMSWSKMMILLLTSKGLWKIVNRRPRTGGESHPGTPNNKEVKNEPDAHTDAKSEQFYKASSTNKTTQEEDDEKTTKKDATALLLLFTHTADTIHNDLLNVKTSTEGWLKLKEKYTKSGIERSMWIRNEITRQRLRDHPNMDSSLTKLQTLHSELCAAGGGDTMSDAALTLHALSNLTPTYDTYKVFIQMGEVKDLKSSSVFPKLRRAEQTLNAEIAQGKSRDYETGLLVDENKKLPCKFFAKGLECYKGDKCKFAHDDKNKTPMCPYCNKGRHEEQDCYKKRNDERIAYAHEDFELLMFAEENTSDDDKQNDQEGTEQWCLDSGASSHITNNMEGAVNIRPCNRVLALADDRHLRITAVADLPVKVTNEKHVTRDGLLQDILIVPEVKRNVISTSKLTKNGLTILFKADNATIRSKGMNLMKFTIKNQAFYATIHRRLNHHLLEKQPAPVRSNSVVLTKKGNKF
jgi:hypothetical protein